VLIVHVVLVNRCGSYLLDVVIIRTCYGVATMSTMLKNTGLLAEHRSLL